MLLCYLIVLPDWLSVVNNKLGHQLLLLSQQSTQQTDDDCFTFSSASHNLWKMHLSNRSLKFKDWTLCHKALHATPQGALAAFHGGSASLLEQPHHAAVTRKLLRLKRSEKRSVRRCEVSNSYVYRTKRTCDYKRKSMGGDAIKSWFVFLFFFFSLKTHSFSQNVQADKKTCEFRQL